MTLSRIAVVGGHGKIARFLSRALAPTTEVRALVRSEDQFVDIEADGAVPVLVDVETASVAEIATAFGDAEAVVFAAGGGPNSGKFRKYTVDLAGSVKAVQAARAAGIDRFVQISFIGADRPTAEGTEEVFAAYWDAKREADNALRAAGLDFTIVKPGMLTDEPSTGGFEVATGGPRVGASSSREGVAQFIAAILDDRRTIGLDLDVLDGDRPLAEALDAALA